MSYNCGIFLSHSLQKGNPLHKYDCIMSKSEEKVVLGLAWLAIKLSCVAHCQKILGWKVMVIFSTSTMFRFTVHWLNIYIIHREQLYDKWICDKDFKCKVNYFYVSKYSFLMPADGFVKKKIRILRPLCISFQNFLLKKKKERCMPWTASLWYFCYKICMMINREANIEVKL